MDVEFVNNLYNECIIDDKENYKFDKIEEARESLKKDTTEFDFHELGGGSKKQGTRPKTISSIAKNSLSFPYQCRVMFRLVKYLQAKSILELGTSLGISTSYLASADSSTSVHTLEGDRNSLLIAKKIFKDLDLQNIKATLGNFKDTLQSSLEKIGEVDLVFIDGHHNEPATLEYFEIILPFCNKNAVIIVDDIYWSNGMQSAWSKIKKRSDINVSLDLFFCGIVLLGNYVQEKEHYIIKPGKLLFHL